MAKTLVFVETMQGQVADIGFELLDLARRAMPSGELVALVAGPESALGELGAADRVLWLRQDGGYAPDVLAQALAAAIARESPDLVLVGSTAVGLDVATYAAGLSGLGQVAYVQAVAPEGSGFRAQSLILGGKLIAHTAIAGPAVLQVLAGSGDAEAGRRSGCPPVEEIAAPEGRVRFLAFEEPQGGDVDISKQEILVSVGRGIGDETNIELAEDLAQALGGVVSSSRPVVDAGWLPKTRQVGKSGRKVRPRLYLALGISGAPEHLEGMRDADCIVAVNTDPSAPIFEVAHYGIVEDVLDFIPALTEGIQDKRG